LRNTRRTDSVGDNVATSATPVTVGVSAAEVEGIVAKAVSAATSVVQDEFEKIVSFCLRENLTLVEVRLNEAEKNLELATKKIEELETYSRRDNLVIVGLPVESNSEAASTTRGEEPEPGEAVEKTVLIFFNQQLQLNIQSCVQLQYH